MTVKSEAIELLRRVRKHLEVESKWAKGANEKLNDKGETCHCLQGAIGLLGAGTPCYLSDPFLASSPDDPVFMAAYEVGVRGAYALSRSFNASGKPTPRLRKMSLGRGVAVLSTFNDHRNTKHEDVLDVLDATITGLEESL